MLTAKDIGYWYGSEEDYLYKDVNLSFKKGTSYAILGSSGSGKTTFLSLLSGLDKPRQGEIIYQDQGINAMGLTKYRRQGVSIVFQAYNLLPYMTALQNILTAMEITNVKRQDKKEFALKMLESVGIQEKMAHQLVTKLSGGQQQRVAIVRAMCCDSTIIVADEPTGNLDAQTSKEIVNILNETAHVQNKTVIIVTHEQSVATTCDHIFELRDREFHQLK